MSMLRILFVRISFSAALFALLPGAAWSQEPPNADGAATPVRIVLLPQGDDRPVAGALHLEPADGQNRSPIEISVDSPRIETELPAGTTWTLDPRIDGYWAPKGSLQIGNEPVVLRVPLLPTGTLTGKLRPPSDGAELPEILYARVESPRANARPRKVGGGLFPCPIQDDRTFRCELPAAPLDLSFRVAGHVPVYRWDVGVEAGKVSDIGSLELEHGSSLTGWVVTGGGEPLSEDVVATLVPSLPAGSDSDALERARGGAERKPIGEDGFFQFTGVPAGPYRVEIDAASQGTAVASISIRVAEETLLRQPLVLRAPVDLGIEILPALDWAGRPWTVVVSRASDDAGTYDSAPFARRSTGEDGRVDLSGQAPGLFKLDVLDSAGNAFWSDRVWSVDAPHEAQRLIEIPLVVIAGEVTLGDEPLPAKIWFGGRYGERRVDLESDEEGRYEGVLPEGGEWLVELRSLDGLARAEEPVDVEPGSDGVAEVDLRLPDTEVFGKVLDSEGDAVAGASVLVGGDGHSVNQTSDEQGEFRVRGLPPGSVHLSAFRDRHGPRTRRPLTLPLTEGVQLGPIELVLEEARTLAGTVLHAGRPVAGAIVDAHLRPHGGFGDRARTDAAGRFELQVAESPLVDLIVSPPYGGLTTARIDPAGAEEIVVEVAENPGTLRFEVPEDEGTTYGNLLRLSRDEILLSMQALAGWMQTNGGAPAPSARDYTLPRMAPGQYTLCFGTRDQAEDLTCTSGVLTPGGVLELSLR